MSTLIDDKKVLDKKREALKDVDAPLRDQIQKKLMEKLEKLDIGRKVSELWTTENSQRQSWLNKQQVYLQDLDTFEESASEEVMGGNFNLHIPMPMIVAKTLHARFYQALVGIEPFFTTKARREDSVERAQLVQDVMQYALIDWANNYQGVTKELDSWIWNWVTTGKGLLKLRWACEYERFVDVVEELEQGPPQFSTDEEGNSITQPTVRLVEKEKEVVAKTFEGPCFEYIDNEDVIIVGGKNDPQKADAVLQTQDLTASQLWTLADRKIFDVDVVKEIVKGGSDSITNRPEAQIKLDKSFNSGESELDKETDLDRYQVIEAYIPVDVDGSGINTKVVCWVHLRSKKLLHANYLRRLNKSGEIPLFCIEFLRIPGRKEPLGVLELVHPLSVEMNAMHNMRLDAGMYSALPFGFYRASSSINPEKIYFEPGALIPVDDPARDVFFPNLGNRTVFGFQEEQALQTLVERLININDMSLGVMTGAQGATRTATGARALLGESNANLDVYLRRMQLGWKQALKCLLHMLQQRIPKGLSFRVTGEDGNDYWRQIQSQMDIVGDFDFEVCANTANSNPQIQQQMAQENLTMVMNPLLIQIGAVNVGNIYEALKDWMKARGVKDFSKYVSKPPQYMHMLTPEDEANRILRGIPVPITPEMDHPGFLAYFEEIYNSDELLGQFTEEQAIALKKQADGHQKMLAALEQQAREMANLQQMQSNAMNGQAQAPVGMNPMAGGQPQ